MFQRQKNGWRILFRRQKDSWRILFQKKRNGHKRRLREMDLMRRNAMKPMKKRQYNVGQYN